MSIKTRKTLLDCLNVAKKLYQNYIGSLGTYKADLENVYLKY